MADRIRVAYRDRIIHDVLRDGHIRAQFSNVYSARQAHLKGSWVIHLWRGDDNTSSTVLYLSEEARTSLIHQLAADGGIDL